MSANLIDATMRTAPKSPVFQFNAPGGSLAAAAMIARFSMNQVQKFAPANTKIPMCMMS